MAMTPALAAVARAKVPHEVREYEHHADADSFGMEAADSLGLDPASVFKTLVVQVDGDHLGVALVPVAGSLDLKAAAGALGGKRAAMAGVKDAERTTGYVAGGISPLGQRRKLPTVIDGSVLRLDRVWVSAGRRGLQLGLAPADLVRLTEGTVAAIARPDG